MRTRLNLHLLREHLGGLARTGYFSPNIRSYLAALVDVISHVLDNTTRYPDQVCLQLQRIVWTSCQYLSGSVSRETPYEMGFALKCALNDWLDGDITITTALAEDQDFHLRLMDPWHFVATTITDFPNAHFQGKIVHVALPRLYKSKPLYCIPLYHELGHFVDITFEISKRCAVLNGRVSQVDLAHYREHFADVFAASYCGTSINDALKDICGGAGASPTHPSTQNRIDLVSKFLNAEPDVLLDQFNTMLVSLKLRPIRQMYSEPDVASSFGRILCCRLRSVAEVHGIFSAGARYLRGALERHDEPWSSMEEFVVERIINDLVEKSIRNFAVTEKWKNASASRK